MNKLANEALGTDLRLRSNGVTSKATRVALRYPQLQVPTRMLAHFTQSVGKNDGGHIVLPQLAFTGYLWHTLFAGILFALFSLAHLYRSFLRRRRALASQHMEFISVASSGISGRPTTSLHTLTEARIDLDDLDDIGDKDDDTDDDDSKDAADDQQEQGEETSQQAPKQKSRKGKASKSSGTKQKSKEETPKAKKVAKSYTAANVLQARKQFVQKTLSRGIQYDEGLPICQAREQISAAIRDHQVVVISGETGSGKTTQLPKICLELGRGQAGLIGHTQPRRLAARAVANRIAEELQTKMGEGIGYQVRFTDESSDATCCKLMTDGILLAEIPGDRLLSNYDTIIIDEAHERSLNIDFLLGYLKGILPQRPDLKVIVMSATIDSERFAEHFDGAPVIAVSGRTYPVELIYQSTKRDSDDPVSIRAAIDTLIRREQENNAPPGDVLVFLPGEREIQEAWEYLRGALRGLEILPLYARLSRQEQDQIFNPSGEKRRVVLATNVAETSLTVPGITYVVDTGTARVSRYSVKSRVQGLRIEEISQASANQRKGRCGRLGPGICVRTYTEENFLERAAFTDPEILRTNLASVILQMLSMGLGDVGAFPFLDKPRPRAINDGLALLRQLDALDGNNELTRVGKQLARLPLDPQLGAMLLAASREGALNEMLVIVSGLAAQDPRNRPADRREAADAAHALFNHPGSDFMTLLNLWDAYQAEKKAGRSLWRWCDQNFLSFTRMKEWQDLHKQLKDACSQLRLRQNTKPPSYGALHRAILAGLPDMVGVKDERNEQYRGCGGKLFRIHPSSPKQNKGMKWIIVGDMVETTQVYANYVARFEPQWVEMVLPHLIKTSYNEPHWDKEAKRVSVYKEVSLLGLELLRKKVAYHAIDAAKSREIFIREGLCADAYDSGAECLTHNRAILEEIQKYDTKLRRRSSMDPKALYDFYDSIIPSSVSSPWDFEKWYAEEAATKEILFLPNSILEDLKAKAPDELYPDTWTFDGQKLPLTYRYLPGVNTDGVTLTVPILALGAVRHESVEWLVPGLLPSKLENIITGLPGYVRSSFPPDVTQKLMLSFTDVEFGQGCLWTIIRNKLATMATSKLSQSPAELCKLAKIPQHLKLRIEVVDVGGRVVAEGRDLDVLREKCVSSMHQELPASFVQRYLADWTFGNWPKPEMVEVAGLNVIAYPALLDEGSSVSLTAYADPAYAEQCTIAGVTRLALLSRPRLRAELERQMKNAAGSSLEVLSMNLSNNSNIAKQSLSSNATRAPATPPPPKPDPVMTSAASGFANEGTRANSPFRQLQALRNDMVISARNSPPKPAAPALKVSSTPPPKPKPSPTVSPPPPSTPAPPATLSITAEDLARKMMAPKSQKTPAPPPPPTPPPKPTASQIAQQITAPKRTPVPKPKSKPEPIFAPREAFTSDEAWIRHTYSKMDKVLSSGDLKNPRPANLNKEDMQLLQQFKAASMMMPEASKILGIGINKTNRVDRILTKRGPQASQAVRELKEVWDDDMQAPKRRRLEIEETGTSEPQKPRAAPVTVENSFAWRLFKDVCATLLEERPLPKTVKEFEALVDVAAPKVLTLAPPTAAAIASALKKQKSITARIAQMTNKSNSPAMEDIQSQMQRIFTPNWITHTPAHWLLQIPRFLEAVDYRLDALYRPRDQTNQAEMEKYWQKYLQVRKAHGDTPKVVEFRWLIEEFRVSLFAQVLKTSVTISAKRLDTFLQEITNG